MTSQEQHISKNTEPQPSTPQKNPTSKEQQQQQPLPPHLDPKTYPRTLHEPTKNIHLELTYNPLNPTKTLSQISSPSAGANVLFIGTTRNTFEDRPVKLLSYSSYAPLAMKTMYRIAEDAVDRFGLMGVSISHRLGVVPVCEGSIVVGVSSGHRGAGWEAGEYVLEVIKEKVEVWKREVFEDEAENGDGGEEGGGGGGGGVWRANRDRDAEGRLRELA